MLSEKAILSAGEADYMNQEQLDFFRDRLQAMLAEFEQRTILPIASGDELIAAADPLDRASMEGERTTILKTQERDAQRKAEIAAALRRIEDGDYGFCEDTGEPIGLKRLLAYPSAKLSLEAQQVREHANRFGRKVA